MRIPVSFHTALKTAELLAFLDSGATECFVSQRFIDKHKLGTRLLTIPRKLQNADGSPNAGGELTHFTELEVFMGDTPQRLRFYIADMGPDDLVLGYPWFAATNAQPNWADGTLPATVTIRTKGAASGKPMPPLKVASIRTKTRRPPFLRDGDELYVRIIKTDRSAKTTVAQQLAEQATDKTICPWDQIVPPQYHQHARVFSETEAHRFPELREWDHAINLKADAPSTLDCKVYPLSPGEDTALQTFLSENLAKGYIRQSKSPYAFPFFFIKKKNGDLQPVQDYCRLNAFTVRNTAPLPLIRELMDRLTRVHGRRSALFTKLDIRWGYNNICIRDGDQWKAAFKTNRGLFEPMVMFFGLTNAPATFQSMMNFIFRELINKGYVTIYMDDILIHTPHDVDLHRRVINDVLQILADNDLYCTSSHKNASSKSRRLNIWASLSAKIASPWIQSRSMASKIGNNLQLFRNCVPS